MSALSSFVIGAGNLASQAYWNNRNIAFQERQNQRNRQMAWDMWNAENRYNSPAAQMARLRAAGLNSGLMYSDGSAGMPAAQFQSPEQTAPQGKPLYLDPQTLANARLSDAQADLAEAQARETQSRIPINQQTVLNMQQDVNESIARIFKLSQDVNESSKRVELMDTDNALKSIDLFYRDKQHQAELDYIYAKIYRLDVENWKTFHDVENAMTSLMIMAYEAQTGRMNAVTNRNLADANIKLTQQQINEYRVQWEALGVHFRPDGSIVLDEHGALATEKGERARHTALYQYIKDYFGVVGQVFSGSAGMVFGRKPK